MPNITFSIKRFFILFTALVKQNKVEIPSNALTLLHLVHYIYFVRSTTFNSKNYVILLQ